MIYLYLSDKQFKLCNVLVGDFYTPIVFENLVDAMTRAIDVGRSLPGRFVFCISLVAFSNTLKFKDCMNHCLDFYRYTTVSSPAD